MIGEVISAQNIPVGQRIAIETLNVTVVGTVERRFRAPKSTNWIYTLTDVGALLRPDAKVTIAEPLE